MLTHAITHQLLNMLLLPQSFLCLPIFPPSDASSNSNSSAGEGPVLGTLTFGSTRGDLDWQSLWWMPSVQLLCGWAAGALTQARAVERASVFDALDACSNIEQMAAVFVHQLPHALIDQVGWIGLI